MAEKRPSRTKVRIDPSIVLVQLLLDVCSRGFNWYPTFTLTGVEGNSTNRLPLDNVPGIRWSGLIREEGEFGLVSHSPDLSD